MNEISKETRLESYLDILGKRQNKYKTIVELMYHLNRPASAKELAVLLYRAGLTGSSERNMTAPRLTELEDIGIVEVVGKFRCDYSKKNVALYQLKGE